VFFDIVLHHRRHCSAATASPWLSCPLSALCHCQDPERMIRDRMLAHMPQLDTPLFFLLLECLEEKKIEKPTWTSWRPERGWVTEYSYPSGSRQNWF
jgi:hypothetical protein